MVKVIKSSRDPSNFTQTGLAAIYDAEPNSNLTASGEAFDPTQLTAAHPTLPIPSYVRVTNVANGRMIVVRINDRGPYGTDRVISLSRLCRSPEHLQTPKCVSIRSSSQRTGRFPARYGLYYRRQTNLCATCPSGS